MPLPLPQYTPGVPNLLSKPRKEAGAFFEFDPDIGNHDWMTCMCVHCGRHWRYIPGSGKERGFCMHCMGITCGRRQCDPCVPMEKMIEDLEAAFRRQENLRIIRRQ
jgi:hypothetical protein